MKAANALDYFDPAHHDVTNLLTSYSFYPKLHPGAPDQWDKNLFLFQRVD